VHLIDAGRWRDIVNEDPEFLLAARDWTARLRVRMGDAEMIVGIRDGRIAAIESAPTPFHAWDAEIGGPRAGWEQFLEPLPRPFYQDLFPAMVHHGFTIAGDLESVFAYHPALRRMFDLMRQAVPR
jgi:hypothetical protein